MLDIKKIKTLYATWKILYQEKVMLNNKEKLGTVLFTKHLIKISTKQSILDIIETILHEVLHIIFEELDMDFTDEKKINPLSRVLVKFVRENPEYIKIILNYKGEV
ncbi:hypothetical protein CVT91_00130 [Candidatus Atribacteria bacterium HGW-Atribacteria-1]|nr:MAG: hypothetical protein CVT91_00130 [Candidatus Atribacteria bacterium HGW-Atribacteria-1]